MTNLHSAVLEWLKEKMGTVPLAFNFIPAASSEGGPGASGGVVPGVSAPFVKRFLRGGIKQYIFDLVLFSPAAFDALCADENIDNMEQAQEVLRWIEEQNALKNFPDFGDTPVQSVECLSCSPKVKAIGDKAGTASYTVTVRILYLARA